MRRRGESGASLVEVGLILPILITLAIGLSEIGFLVVDYMTVTNAAREGARTGAAAANFPTADEIILDAVEEASCNLRFGTLEKVRIFQADGTGQPVVGSINEYSPSGSLTCDAPGNSLNCDNTCPWTAAGRDREPPGLDVLGVEVTFSHTSVTGIFPFPTVDWDETAVMQIEPDTRGTQ